jgi:DNA-directed RNA polymerase subunit M/transcription elongation factor TFIIS
MPVSPQPFKCPACGHQAFERVEVTRLDGSRYSTEFVACVRCRVMAWRPELAKTPQAPDFRRGWGARG